MDLKSQKTQLALVSSFSISLGVLSYLILRNKESSELDYQSFLKCQKEILIAKLQKFKELKEKFEEMKRQKLSPPQYEDVIVQFNQKQRFQLSQQNHYFISQVERQKLFNYSSLLFIHSPVNQWYNKIKIGKGSEWKQVTPIPLSQGGLIEMLIIECGVYEKWFQEVQSPLTLEKSELLNVIIRDQVCFRKAIDENIFYHNFVIESTNLPDLFRFYNERINSMHKISDEYINDNQEQVEILQEILDTTFLITSQKLLGLMQNSEVINKYTSEEQQRGFLQSLQHTVLNEVIKIHKISIYDYSNMAILNQQHVSIKSLQVKFARQIEEYQIKWSKQLQENKQKQEIKEEQSEQMGVQGEQSDTEKQEEIKKQEENKSNVEQLQSEIKKEETVEQQIQQKENTKLESNQEAQ